MGQFSITHLLILAVIFLIFFGPSRLPQLGESLGKAIRGFKQGLNEIDAEAKEIKDPPPQQQQTQIAHTQAEKSETQKSDVTDPTKKNTHS